MEQTIGKCTRCNFFFFFFQKGANSEVGQYRTTVMGPGARCGSSDAKQQKNKADKNSDGVSILMASRLLSSVVYLFIRQVKNNYN